MNLAAEAPQWLAIILAVLLLAAAAEDAARFRISNLTCLLVLIGAIAAATLAGPELSLWQNLAVLAGLLAAGTPLFAAGKFGGGDVKLLAATGLWFDLFGALQMLVWVFLAGGALALLVLATRMIRGRSIDRRAAMTAASIPYGVAIAVGALVALWMQRA